MTTTKMTNSMALDFVLTNCELADDVREKIVNIKASIDKKNAKRSTGEKKPTKAQIENEALREKLLAQMVEGEKYTATDVLKTFDGFADMTNQKISALMRGLIADGKVVKSDEKRIVYYALA